MEMRVYKYELECADHAIVEMPVGAKILSIHSQRDRVCIWALIDPSEARTVKRSFRVAGAGHPIEFTDQYHFVGTVFLHGGALVFHVFEFRR